MTGVKRNRKAFTLVEMLVTIAVITILASSILFAMYGTIEAAYEARTRAKVVRINEMVMTRWESFRSRAVPLRIAAATRPTLAAQQRLAALRELQRMELPDRITDVADGDVPAGIASGIARPALHRSYDRFVTARWGKNWRTTVNTFDATGRPTGWSFEHQGAECLYMILANIHDGGSTGLESFSRDDLGDSDDDLMPEILDAWGNPIQFLRWAPGFSAFGSDTPSDLHDRAVPDPFDYLRVDPRFADASSTNNPFAIYPLIFSAGRDEVFDILVDITPPLRYRAITPPNDPYVGPATLAALPAEIGTPVRNGWQDNIHNHLLQEK